MDEDEKKQAAAQAAQEAAAAAAAAESKKPVEPGFTQAELDRRVNQALEKERAKFAAQIEAAKEAGKTEGEKLAKMSEQEKADAAAKAREDALAKREAELNLRELKATVTVALSEKKLPTSLAETLVGLGSAEAISAAIEKIEGAVTAQVSEGVKASLRQSDPQNAPTNVDGKTRADMSLDELNALYQKDPAAYAALK